MFHIKTRYVRHFSSNSTISLEDINRILRNLPDDFELRDNALILYLQNALVSFNHLKDKYKSYFDEYKQKEEKLKILKLSDEKKSQMDNTNNNILLANLRNFKYETWINDLHPENQGFIK